MENNNLNLLFNSFQNKNFNIDLDKTPEEIEIEWENYMTEQGIARYNILVNRAKETKNEDNLLPQHNLIIKSIKPMSEALQEIFDNQGNAGVKRKVISYDVMT